MRMIPVVRGVLCGVALAVAGCGGGGGYNPPAPGPSPTPTPPPAGQVDIVGQRGSQSFNPNPSTAPAQGLVWRNADGVVHRIVANDGSFDTGDLAPGASSAPVPVPAGGANYHCSLHPAMVGAINSSAGQPPPCTGIYC